LSDKLKKIDVTLCFQVFVDQLTSKDMEFIGDSIFSNIDQKIIAQMVEFSNKVCSFCLTYSLNKNLLLPLQTFIWPRTLFCYAEEVIPALSEPGRLLASLQLVQEVCVERRWGQKGSPWEFNLRDMFRWCQLMQNDQSPGFFNPGQHVALVYADRMRTEDDKAQVHRFTNLSVFSMPELQYLCNH